MNAFNACVAEIAALSEPGRAYSATGVDRLVDAFLVGFGAEAASVRIALAEAAYRASRPSALNERIRWRVLRDGPELPLTCAWISRSARTRHSARRGRRRTEHSCGASDQN